jgi:hypothetical protein
MGAANSGPMDCCIAHRGLRPPPHSDYEAAPLPGQAPLPGERRSSGQREGLGSESAQSRLRSARAHKSESVYSPAMPIPHFQGRRAFHFPVPGAQANRGSDDLSPSPHRRGCAAPSLPVSPGHHSALAHSVDEMLRSEDVIEGYLAMPPSDRAIFEDRLNSRQQREFFRAVFQYRNRNNCA